MPFGCIFALSPVAIARQYASQMVWYHLVPSQVSDAKRILLTRYRTVPYVRGHGTDWCRFAKKATKPAANHLPRYFKYVGAFPRATPPSALSDRVESPDRKEFAPIQKFGACPCRKS